MAKARRPRAPLNAVRIMRQDYLTFGSPHIGEEEIAEVVATLRSGWIGTGLRTTRRPPGRPGRRR